MDRYDWHSRAAGNDVGCRLQQWYGHYEKRKRCAASPQSQSTTASQSP
jgi:hypothetical protein